MKTMLRPLGLSTALLVAASSLVSAQTTITEIIPIPPEVMTSGILWASLAGPPNGYVVRVGVHAEFHPAGGFTADAVEMRMNAPTEPNSPEWVLQGGATFGWSATSAVQVGDAETLMLDGELQSFFPWSIWEFSIGPVAGSGFSGVTGHFQSSYFEVEYIPQGEGPGVGYCFGTSCPCGNDDGGAGCANSTGSGALLAASGTGSLASSDLAFAASGLAAGQFGLFYTGRAQLVAPFGDGLRCVGAGAESLHRFPVLQANAAGDIVLADVFSSAQASFPGALSAGETWNFQTWYRDPGGPCGAAFNLSNALSITVIP